MVHVSPRNSRKRLSGQLDSDLTSSACLGELSTLELPALLRNATTYHSL